MTEDLGRELAESADRMAAKLDELSQTRVEVPEKDIMEISGPLEGYAREPFFEPVAAFSGQDLGLIQALYDLVYDVWMHADEHASGFNSGMNHVLGNWAGPAATECATYVGNMVGFVANEQQSLSTFAEGLATYYAVIKAGRQSLITLMGECVNGWDQATRVGEVAAINVGISALTAMTGFATTISTGGAALPAFQAAVTGIIGAGVGATAILSGKHADIADAYLKASRDLVAQAVTAINNGAIKHLNNAKESLPHVPTLPVGITDKTKFYPESAEPSGFMGPRQGTGDPPSKIEKTLG